MDLSFDLVASKCADQMAQYQQNTDCVPHLAELKRTCATQISTYRTCLEKNGSKEDDVVREKCSDALKALWECSEKRVAELEKAAK